MGAKDQSPKWAFLGHVQPRPAGLTLPCAKGQAVSPLQALMYKHCPPLTAAYFHLAHCGRIRGIGAGFICS